jgi:hypothetical protein
VRPKVCPKKNKKKAGMIARYDGIVILPTKKKKRKKRKKVFFSFGIFPIKVFFLFCFVRHLTPPSTGSNFFDIHCMFEKKFKKKKS